MNPNPNPVWAVIALGSNLGDALGQVRSALGRLEVLSASPLRVSSYWETEPVECPAGSPWFVNAVAGLVPRPGESPESLLNQLQALERALGRTEDRLRHAPRPLDLDLIAFGTERRATARLVLPHPRAHQRRFVLAPLAEIAPALVLPGQSRTVGELLDQLPLRPVVRRIAPERP